jgi:arabinogalactan oligomer / maltooligosaccharide transport system permease protein
MHEEATRLPFIKWIAFSILDIFIKIGMIIFDMVVTVLKAILQIFISIYKVIIFLAKGIYHGGKYFINTFIKGNYKTRLSYLFMGAGAFLNGQIAKGIGYLVTQLGLISLITFLSMQYLVKFGTLGTQLTQKAVYDPDTETWLPAVEGDNSMLILLFSVAAVMLIVALLLIYWKNIKLAYNNQLAKANGQSLPTFKTETKELLNNRFHVTILSLPTITVMIFTILPLLFMILIAFTNFDAQNQPPGGLFTWVGFNNFINMFVGTGSGYSALPRTLGSILRWSIVWSIFATFLNYIFGMILALMINKKGIRLKKMWRTIFVMTIAIPQFVSLMVIARFLSTSGPVINMLANLNIVDSNYNLFGTALSARITVIIVNLWVGIPYTMLITSGILMNIPADLYESATIDGANSLTKFIKITLPYMLFVTGPYLVTTFIGNINNFNVIFFVTGGGPSNIMLYQAGDTDLLITWLYRLTLTYSDYKMASMLGIIIFMITSFISLVLFSKTGAVQREEQFQ